MTLGFQNAAIDSKGSNALLDDWMRGTHTSIQGLLRARLFSRELNLRKQKKIMSSMVGGHQSKIRGRGMDFSEVRLYQPGDDIRSIDWKVTAKTTKPHTKLYSEEKERPIFLLIDQRPGMFFGSKRCYKSVAAAEVAALLAWSAQSTGDKVGGLIFSNNEEIDLRPKQNRKQLLGFIHQLNEYNHKLSAPADSQPERLSDIIKHLRQVVGAGSSVYIISDFFGFDEEAVSLLHQIKRHNDVTAISIHDPLEVQLPTNGGRLTFYGTGTSAKDSIQIDTSDTSMSSRYTEHFLNQQAELESTLNKVGIPMISISTAVPPLDALQAGLGLKRSTR